jgi:hypothetical protein
MSLIGMKVGEGEGRAPKNSSTHYTTCYTKSQGYKRPLLR